MDGAGYKWTEKARNRLEEAVDGRSRLQIDRGGCE